VGTVLAAFATGACERPKPDVNTSGLNAPASSAPATAAPAAPAEDPVQRGEYLVLVGGCNDCHTPMKMGPAGPEPDLAARLSGHPAAMKMPAAPRPQGPWLWFGAASNTAFAGPWGVSFATNLTSDEETGIGGWSEQVFLNALRTGRHLGVGRPILPPMPWQSYAQMKEEDLKAVHAYLKTVPAVKNKTPESIVAPAPSH
jgi:mono/diheme cytochrome c family protein